MQNKTKRTLLCLCISLAVILACATTLQISRGVRIFRKYVCNPIPKSVEDIKTHRPWELNGHRYVMHFKISKADLNLVLKSGRFRKMMDVSYGNGIIHVTVDPSQGEMLPVYRVAQDGPDWFRPHDWDNPEVYLFKEKDIEYRDHLQILIYNEKLAEAYFVEYQQGY